ncbi:LamG-like jellyroll fold domain-containing protein [Planktothrix sp. FACHB-1365]|uniref:LamG-like jellyroll fold domain-containing protein n=1 Tax=Planktothrix sp. FACHB-1365 TaxID=2692855 RepID=UPI0016894EC0|nr:LamG-like jellyroll fold domain-containing protein [Planktothrix sp. FACHB-1365]MBD2483429.1 ricin-type beta-trefoil lectin domain protein [Planktothrix sp. FACHB-1365]
MDNQYVLSFDGKDDDVGVPLKMYINFSQGFTVEAWVLYHSFPNRSIIISFVNTSDGYQFFQLMNYQTTRKLALHFQCLPSYSRIAVDGYVISDYEILETGIWMHIAATVNSSNNVTFYKNGEVVKTGSLPLPPAWSGQWEHLSISHGRSSNDSLFQGCITEVRLWNVVRSVDEIRADKNRRLNGDEKGLVNYWPLNEISGNRVVNKANNSHPGEVHGGATIVEANPPLQLIPTAYLIKSKLNGLALVGTPNNPATTGAVDSQNPLQRWIITADGVIKNEAGFVLDYQDYGSTLYYVVMANRIQGTQGSPSQQWRIENGVIKNKHKADLVLDIAGSNPAANTAILAAPWMGELNQKWEIVSV